MPRYRLIFVPGIMGSSLELIPPGGATPRVVWDGNVFTIFRTIFTEPEVLHAFTSLRPVDIIQETTIGPVPYQDIYKTLFSFLRNTLNYDGENLFAFPYDWRQSVFTEAQRLIDFIDKELPSGDQDIVILGHSLGALVARVAVMTDSAKLISKGVAKVIELAPPHLGSSLALERTLEVWGLTSLRRILGRYLLAVPLFEGLVLALARSMPSLWQLFPSKKEQILVNNTNPQDTRAALDWPGWASAVEIMARPTAENLHKVIDEIPHRWPGAIEECVVYSRSHWTPYTFPFDPQPPYGIATNRPIRVRGDRVVWEWSASLHYTPNHKHEVDFYHRIIAGDPKTLSVLQQELQ